MASYIVRVYLTKAYDVPIETDSPEDAWDEAMYEVNEEHFVFEDYEVTTVTKCCHVCDFAPCACDMAERD